MQPSGPALESSDKRASWSTILRTGWSNPTIFSRRLAIFLALGGALPLLSHRIVLGIDTPQHLAISDILARLVRGDLAAATYYAVNWQPVPYYFFYILTSLFALVLPTMWAGRLVMVFSYFSVVAALALGIRRLRLPPVFLLGAAPLFYSWTFLWGFWPNLLGLGFALGLMSELSIEADQSDAPRTVVCVATAVLATLSHIVFFPSVLIIAGARLFTTRRQWRAPVFAAVSASAISACGVLPIVLADAHDVTGGSYFNTPAEAYHRIKQYLTSVDFPLQTWAQWSTLYVLMLLAVTTLVTVHKDGHRRRLSTMLGIIIKGHISMMVLLPHTTTHAVHSSWGLDWRGLPVALAALMVLAAVSPLWQTRVNLGVQGALAVVFSLSIFAMLSATDELEKDVQPWPTLSQIQPHARMAVVNQHLGIHPYGLALRMNLPFWGVLAGTSWAFDLFGGEHLPIIHRNPEQEEYRQNLAKGLLAYAVQRERVSIPLEQVRRIWDEMDLIWWQDTRQDFLKPDFTGIGEIVARGHRWLLIGPPKTQQP